MDALFTNGRYHLDLIGILRYFSRMCEIGMPVIKYDIQLDVIAQNYNQYYVDEILVFEVVWQSNVPCDEDYTER